MYIVQDVPLVQNRMTDPQTSEDKIKLRNNGSITKDSLLYTFVMSISSCVLWWSKCPTPINPLDLYQFRYNLNPLVGLQGIRTNQFLLHYQCQSEHELNFIWINTLISMSIRTWFQESDSGCFSFACQEELLSPHNQSGVYFQMNVFWVLFYKLS